MNEFIKYSILISFLTATHAAFGQQQTGIYIGQAADSVQAIVGQEVQGHYNAGGYLVKMSAQTIDYKGRPKEVIFCKENVLIHNLEKGVNFCIHYVMDKDTLSRIVTHYSNLSFDEVRQLILSDRRISNMAGYYFDRDYKAYKRILITGNGSILTEYRKTIKSQLPLTVQEQLKMIAGIWQ